MQRRQCSAGLGACPFREFNSTLKRFLRSMRDRFPEADGALTAMIVAYKMMKSMNRKWPQRFFHDSLLAPNEEHLRRRDEAFFLDPAGFRLPGCEAIVDSLRAEWRRMDARGKELVWDSVALLVEKSEACASPACSRSVSGQLVADGGGGEAAVAQACAV